MVDIGGSGLAELSATAVFFALFFATFISEDAACLAAGSLVAMGEIGFGLALAACFTGIFVGDAMLFAAGRMFGRRLLNSPVTRRYFSDHSFQRASAWLEERGAAAVFLSRFVTGLRLPTYLLAGTLRTSFPKFAVYFLLAAAIWTPLLVGSAAFAQSAIFSGNLLIGAAVLFVAIRLLWKLSNFRSRRLLIGRLKRLLIWEFWPIQVFYAPVFLYVLWLGLRFRSLTIFSAANPAIPGGGFRGESKDQIYKGLSESDAAKQFLLPHVLLTSDLQADEKIGSAHKFMIANRLGFPLVLKPDVGERGFEVKVIRGLDQLCDELSSAKYDLILQKYVAGAEMSVFYYRFPTEEAGKVFSITEKHFPTLVGNGRSTLEDLILCDKRAVCQADKYFEQNAERLACIPRNGEKITLTELGTHSRGAVFLDGGWMRTENLERAIDGICRGFKGFYFGRFDLRAGSKEDLMNGENFKIIELNGVTSESTNIYDGRYTLIDAYRILFRQWRLAFEIGAANIERGSMQTPVRELLSMAFSAPTHYPERRKLLLTADRC